MHEMQPIVMDDPVICPSVTQERYTKTAERIDVLFEVEITDPSNSVLDGVPVTPRLAGVSSMWQFVETVIVKYSLAQG